MQTLFINACVRKQSRTLELANVLLQELPQEMVELNLQKEQMKPLNRERLQKRDELLREQNLEDDMFQYARQFANADVIVIAAPYWDLAFPALLKIYMEAITVTGITFCYEEGIPKGLCRAKRLFYVTTAGGPIFTDFGFSYIKTLAENFYGIPETICFRAENLDVIGMDPKQIMEQAKAEIRKNVRRSI